jgi:hypothetical protein
MCPTQAKPFKDYCAFDDVLLLIAESIDGEELKQISFMSV